MISEKLLKGFFETAIVAAQSAGKFIIENVGRPIEINYKGRANAVTEVDRRSEEIIISLIQRTFPNHQIITEESSEIQTDSPYRWIIDPLDGTTNYIHGFPCFAVSIALEYQSRVVLGIVFNPWTQELFSAIKEHGAYLNQTRLKVSTVRKLKDSLLATGFPYELIQGFDRNLRLFKRFYENSQGVRRTGSAAVDLCYTACGRFDAFWEFNLNPWDIAAGALIVSESGGTVSHISGADFSIYNRDILASNGLIHSQMLDIITITD